MRVCVCVHALIAAPFVSLQRLYVKNLAKDVDQLDLVRIFGRFESDSTKAVHCKVFKKGRMKHQAFVTYSGV
jgi:RNA recognition motif-containing protein